MVLVLYPSITSLIDTQNVISESNYITPALLAVRDKAVMQVAGFVFLFVFLGALLSQHGKQPSHPSTSAVSQETEPTMQAQQSPASNEKRSNILFILSGIIFIAVFFWQFASAMMTHGSTPTDVFVYPIIYGLIASGAVGIALYLILKNKIIEFEK
jgi:heme/copper-type cytochrome/quinol oxidase subunit 3